MTPSLPRPRPFCRAAVALPAVSVPPVPSVPSVPSGAGAPAARR
ncbi:hypothetical protein [Piscinibacter sakaiensis]|nr:hypothetical protein [Piscinibacter sakaiensis]